MNISKSVMFLLGSLFGGVCGFVVASERGKKLRARELEDFRRTYRRKLGEQWDAEEKEKKAAEEERLKAEKTQKALNLHEANKIVERTAYSSMAKGSMPAELEKKYAEKAAEKSANGVSGDSGEVLRKQAGIASDTVVTVEDEEEDDSEDDRSDEDSLEENARNEGIWLDGRRPNEKPRPYLVSPEEFEYADGYQKETLFYYELNGMLIDDNDDVIDIVDLMIGYDALDHFGDYVPDRCYVRNERFGVDYEIELIHAAWEPSIPGIDD